MKYYILLLCFLLSHGIAAQTDSLSAKPTEKKDLLNSLAIASHLVYLGIDQQISKEFGIEYLRKTRFGSCIGGINYIEQLGNKGIQLQAQCYPKLWKKAYAHLVLGYSASRAYPQLATGITLIQASKGGFEVELGGRLFQSQDQTKVFAALGGVNKYFKRYLIMYKLWLVKTPTHRQQTHTLQIRCYAKDDKSHLWTALSFGNDSRLDTNGQFVFDTANDRSFSSQLGFSKYFGQKRILSSNLSYLHNRYANQNTRHRIGVAVRFAFLF